MKGWESKALGDVCEILDSRRRPVTKKDRHVGEYPYYGATGIVDYVDEFIFDEPLVLVGEDGAKWGSGEGTAFSVSGRCWVNNHAHVLRPIRTRLLDAWLVYYLVHEDLSPFVSGLTVPKLNQGNLREIPVPLPPVAEQRRIVAILDEAFEAIGTAKANTEKNLRNARELFELQLATALRRGGEDWVEMSIGEACTLRSGTTVPVEIERAAGDVPYVKVAEMTMPANRDGVTTSIRFLDRRDIKQSWVIPAGAVIFPKRGGAILTNKKRPVLVDICADLNIMAVIPSDKLTAEFLYLYFLTVDMRKLGTGSSIPQINNYDIAPLRISFPASRATQAEVAEALRAAESECQALATLYERKLAALDELKKSLLHQAFTGALTAKSTDQQEAVA